MRAVIYCRVSTKEQTANLSLPTQLRACRDYCEREGYEVAQEFTDAGESAKTTDRPEFQKLFEFCRANKRKIQFVVFYNIARLSRNVNDYAVVRSYLQGLGVSVRSVTEPIADDTTGKLLANMLAAIAQFDNDAKSDRTKAGMRAALERGRWPFQAPLGYLNGAQSGKRLLVIDPVRGPLVRAAFEEYGTGRHTKTEVLRRVTALGLTTHAGKPLTAQSLGSLLRNPIYTGWLHVPRWQVSARGDFEALVPDSLFRLVQLLLDGKGQPVRPHSRNHPDFPLRRFVACSHCMTPLTASWSTGRSKKYPYYHCRKCKRVKAGKRSLEGLFVELLSRLQPEAGYMRLFNAIVLDVWNGRQGEAKRLRAGLEAVVTQHRERLDRVDEAFLHERSIDRQSYERQRDQLREQLALAEMELSTATENQLDVEGALAFAEHLLTNAARLWMELGLDQKQQLQQVLFPEGLRFDGEQFGTAPTCLAFMQLARSVDSKDGMASPGGHPVLYLEGPLAA
jgi:site-specific DNA recombinase